jgi:hypothetical protein
MQTTARVAQMLLRLAGLIAVVLGVLFWTGNALGLIAVHMLVGAVLVLSLWVLAILGLRAGARPGIAALAMVWGLAVPVLGLTQFQLLPGSAHWLVQVLHLLLGIGAVGLGESLGAATQRKQAVAA